MRFPQYCITGLASFKCALATQQVLLGPAFPPPVNLAELDSIKSTAANIADTLQNTLSHGFTSIATSLSLTATSVQGDIPFLDFHFSPENLNQSAGSVAEVTADSVYRIGSISKLFTVYALLLTYGTGNWGRPITDFIPELREAVTRNPSPVDEVLWDQVTIESLTSQLGGIGRDYNNADLASQPFPWDQAGLPILPPQDVPKCAGNESLPPCDRKEYFDGLVQRHPVFAPYTTPIYSNAAFRILGYALEAITNSSYPSAMSKQVFMPLGLDRTSTIRPTGKAAGVILNDDESWFHDVGDEAATGGLFSSSKDLAMFGRSILSNQQLSPIETRRWMKPKSHTSSLCFSVGSPWEIYRTGSNITSGRIIDMYTKSGSVGQYQSLLVLIPDFEVSFSILTAGPDAGKAIKTASETVLQAFIPLLEQTAKVQAIKSFAGRYSAPDPMANSSLLLSVDDGPGLLVLEWISGGIDLQATAQAYADATGGGLVKSIRLYPTGLQARETDASNSATKTIASYRALIETVAADANESGPHIFDPNAGQWAVVDNLMYGGIAVDDILFHLDAHGNAHAVEPRVLREVFQKVQCGKW